MVGFYSRLFYRWHCVSTRHTGVIPQMCNLSSASFGTKNYCTLPETTNCLKHFINVFNSFSRRSFPTASLPCEQWTVPCRPPGHRSIQSTRYGTRVTVEMLGKLIWNRVSSFVWKRYSLDFLSRAFAFPVCLISCFYRGSIMRATFIVLYSKQSYRGIDQNISF